MEPLLHCIQHHHKKIGGDAQWPLGGGSYQARDGEGGAFLAFCIYGYMDFPMGSSLTSQF